MRRLVKRLSGAMKRASCRSRAIVAKAASISRMVLALRILICSPSARAAAGISRNVASKICGALAGLRSTAIRTALGTSSCSSPKRLATVSEEKKLTPVRLPPRPGKARDQTKLDRVVADAEHDWDRRGRSLGYESGRARARRRDHAHPTMN